jgi:hypothetical protein
MVLLAGTATLRICCLNSLAIGWAQALEAACLGFEQICPEGAETTLAQAHSLRDGGNGPPIERRLTTHLFKTQPGNLRLGANHLVHRFLAVGELGAGTMGELGLLSSNHKQFADWPGGRKQFWFGR